LKQSSAVLNARDTCDTESSEVFNVCDNTEVYNVHVNSEFYEHGNADLMRIKMFVK
jgi:hypothetical protein